VASTIWVLLGRALRTVDDLRRGAAAITDPSTGNRLPLPASRDEIHHLATTLNDMIDRLAAASERERAFIADAAHELRSPVASIRTQLEMTVNSSDDTAAREFADGALRDVERLSTLVQDLLALARLESSDQPSTAQVDLAAFPGVISSQPCIVNGDAAALARAVDNLRSNAERHATRVRITVEQHGDAIELHVDDDGPGIPPEQRDRIFERLVRLDSARTRDHGGSGLGLAIVAATARAHRGTVRVSDSPLGGARLTLALPAAHGPSAATANNSRDNPVEDRPAQPAAHDVTDDPAPAAPAARNRRS
jgi:signal transduction histidine kinase